MTNFILSPTTIGINKSFEVEALIKWIALIDFIDIIVELLCISQNFTS